MNDLALSLDTSGVTYLPVISTDEYVTWYQLIGQGKLRIKKILRLNKKDLTKSIKITANTKSNEINKHISIGSLKSPTDLTKQRKENATYPNIFLRENDELNYLSTFLSRQS